MATDPTTTTANGLYGGHFGQPVELAANAPSAPSHTPSMSQSTATSATAQKADPREIGWYFVEQYYTTLSKSPEKIHLFYSKKSQLVTGIEAEKVIPAVGTKAISEKIKELDIQDCKVRVLNVDSQASFQNIVVQVIGEMSNKSEPHHKFVQTFVLAEQPNGYFVLNDIFRYLSNDDDEIVDDEPIHAEVPAEEPSTPNEPAVATQSADETITTEGDAEFVDEKLEEEVKNAPSEGETGMNGTEVPISAEEASTVPESSQTTKEEAEEASAEDTTPNESSVSDIAPSDPVKSTTPAAAEVPPAKRTWASMLSTTGKTPAVPALPTNAPSAAPAKAPRVVPQQSNNQKPPAAPSPTPDSATAVTPVSAGQSNGWQTADHGKKTKGAQTKPSSEGVVLAYIKNVTDKVDARILREVLESFGELKYYDVSRQRNCAFVEFADPASYAGAVAANPHTVGTEQIYVEERRPRANAYGGTNASFGRGNGTPTAGRGRGNMQGRTGSQGGLPKDGNRGGFQQRGSKSGIVTPKGRAQGQST